MWTRVPTNPRRRGGGMTYTAWTWGASVRSPSLSTTTFSSFCSVPRAFLSSAPPPLRAVCCALLGAHTDRALVGAWNLLLWPIWGFRSRLADLDPVQIRTTRCAVYGNFDIIWVHFSRLSQLRPTRHAPWTMLYFVPIADRVLLWCLNPDVVTNLGPTSGKAST